MAISSSRTVALLALAAVLLHPTPVHAQLHTARPDWVGSMRDDYDRLMQLTAARPLSSRMLRPIVLEPPIPALDSTHDDPWGWAAAAASDSAPPPGPSLTIFDPSFRLVNNSAVPFGGNDGAMWAGRGLNGLVEGGLQAQAGIFTLQLAPSFTWSENREFALGRANPLPVGASEYGDAWIPSQIDEPQRFGNAAFSVVAPGQSFVRADWRGAAIGVSTANMWWGPGLESSLLMTNNAGGYPHLLAGTGRPLGIWIGDLEVAYVAGRLADSDYWRTDEQPGRNRRWSSSIVATFNPRGAPGLYLGGARTFMQLSEKPGLNFSDLGLAFQTFWKKDLGGFDSGGADNIDQMVSLFGRWVLPAAGFETWAEWGRTDHSWDSRDFVLEPEHSSARILGLRKAFVQRRGLLVAGLELTNLEASRDAAIRSSGSWYTHGRVTQGYTNRGQVIGAGIGPGSSQQLFTLDGYRRWGRVGVRLERVRHDTDAFYAKFGSYTRNQYPHAYHDATFGGGINGAAHMGPVTMSLALMRYYQRNRYAILRNDVQNIQASLRGEWRLPR